MLAFGCGNKAPSSASTEEIRGRRRPRERAPLKWREEGAFIDFLPSTRGNKAPSRTCPLVIEGRTCLHGHHFHHSQKEAVVIEMRSFNRGKKAPCCKSCNRPAITSFLGRLH